MNTTEMKHYISSEWNFALDVPKHWNSFPPVSVPNPYEVIRFACYEDGVHLLVVSRWPHDPKKSLKLVFEEIQMALEDKGFGNFVTAKATIGSRPTLMLDFDKPKDDEIWSCRHYYLIEGTLRYRLGFGTTNKAGMFKLYDRMAKSFVILKKAQPDFEL
jgi:hypothetical protein